MSAINLLLNTMQGEIALMDSLKMDFVKSWKCDFQVVNGMNMPVYTVIEDKEKSTLWRLHMNSFNQDEEAEVKYNSLFDTPVEIKSMLCSTSATKKKKKTKYVQYELF